MTRHNFERYYHERGHPFYRPESVGREMCRPGPHEWYHQGFDSKRYGYFGPHRVSFGPGGLRERLFDSGDFKLFLLKLLSEQPAYGYQLIKTIEQRLAGGYTPSAGVVYPTLTMLEEEGLATVSQEHGKKIYSVTQEGMQYLEANEGRVKAILDRLEDAGRTFQRGRSPEIMRAFINLHKTVFTRIVRENITPEQILKITETLYATAKAIEEV